MSPPFCHSISSYLFLTSCCFKKSECFSFCIDYECNIKMYCLVDYVGVTKCIYVKSVKNIHICRGQCFS
jgi:hypothetical protein